MRIRKLTALTLILTLCLSCAPALAAPLRDARNAEVAHDGIQALVEVVSAAYLGPEPEAWDAQGLNAQTLLIGAEAAPEEQAVARRALAYAMERTAQTTVLSRQEAADLSAQIFTGWAWTIEDSGADDLLRVNGDTVELLAESLENGWRVGAYLYDTVFTDAGAQVRADVFACPTEYTESIQDVPEAAVIWLLNGEFILREAPEAVFGYTLDECAFSARYGDGALAAWQQTDSEEGEYSVCLPSQFAQREEVSSPAPGTQWKNADGTAEIGIYWASSEKSFAETLQNFQNAHPDWTIQSEETFGRMYGFGEGAFEMWVASPDMTWTYCLSMRFPTQRQAEYEFYAELIRNSFIAWGISNG